MAAPQDLPGAAALPREDGRVAATQGPAPGGRRAPAVPCISSDTLLAGATELHILHHGSVYRLKQTALGKLILTK